MVALETRPSPAPPSAIIFWELSRSLTLIIFPAPQGGAICAERTAIVKGVSEGKLRFVGLAVSS